jgi:hypothetical protein
MYIATREINTPEQTYQAGQEVLNPSKRMIETGTVKRVSDVGKRAPAKVPEQSTSTSAGKGKKDKGGKKTSAWFAPQVDKYAAALEPSGSTETRGPRPVRP